MFYSHSKRPDFSSLVFIPKLIAKARFKRRTLHVPNLIPIWVDPNKYVRQLIQTSNLILSNLIAKMNETLLRAVIADQNGGKCEGRDKLWR